MLSGLSDLPFLFPWGEFLIARNLPLMLLQAWGGSSLIAELERKGFFLDSLVLMRLSLHRTFVWNCIFCFHLILKNDSFLDFYRHDPPLLDRPTITSLVVMSVSVTCLGTDLDSYGIGMRKLNNRVHSIFEENLNV